MDTFIHVYFLLVVFAVTVSSQLPCSEENCNNFTIYLGPKWGSKVIQYPNYPKLRGPSEKGIIRPSSTEAGDRTADEPIEIVGEPPLEQPRRVYVRPIPESGRITIEDSNSIDFWGLPSTISPPGVSGSTNNSRWQSTFFASDIGALNLSRRGDTGLDVKQILSMLSDDVSQRVSQLSLSGNNIRYLPPLTFPAAMEYGLQTLLLDNNPMSHLTSYTRFELSRLGRLRVLSLARTRLYYLDPLYIPTLEILDLSDNLLSSVPAGLASLGSLQELYLAGNFITMVTDSSFGPLVNLRVLSLADNRINHIWGSALKDMYRLRTLYLNNNMLKYMPQEAVSTLYLGGNPWQCSCALLSAVKRRKDYDVYSTHIVADTYNVTCTLGDEAMSVALLRQDQVCASDWEWFKAKGSMLVDAKRWLHMHGLPLSAILTIAGWVIIILSMALIVRSLRRSRAKRASLEVPYNVLDDKNIA